MNFKSIILRIVHGTRTIVRYFPNIRFCSLFFLFEQLLRKSLFSVFGKGSEKHFEYFLVRDTLVSAHGEKGMNRMRRRLRTMRNVGSREIILDIGPGDSLFPSYLLNQGFQVIGVDLNIKPIIKTIKIIKADASHLPFKECVFKFITLISVIEHINQVSLCIEELKRVIRYDGEVLITTPVEPRFWHPEHLENLFSAFPRVYIQYYDIARQCRIPKSEVLLYFGKRRMLAFVWLRKT